MACRTRRNGQGSREKTAINAIESHASSVWSTTRDEGTRHRGVDLMRVRIERAGAGDSAWCHRRPGPVRQRSGANVRALPAVPLCSRARVECPVRVPPGGTRTPHGREIPGRRRAVRLHHRSIQQRPERSARCFCRGGAGDEHRRRPPILDRSATSVSGRHVGRSAGGDGHRPHREQHRRRHRVECRVSGQPAAWQSAVRRFQHGGYRGLQLSRDAAARSQTVVAAFSRRVPGRSYPPAR